MKISDTFNIQLDSLQLYIFLMFFSFHLYICTFISKWFKPKFSQMQTFKEFWGPVCKIIVWEPDNSSNSKPCV